MLAPLRPLLSTKNELMWFTEHDRDFRTAKESLTSNLVLTFFDSRKLCTEASQQGLGFMLQQQDGNNWVLIQAGSRFLSDPESQYARIELELLVVAWAITKCKLFLAGLPNFTIITNHHPLIPILNSHRLDELRTHGSNASRQGSWPTTSQLNR